MRTKDEKVSLKNLAKGAAIERFDLELKKIITNILDVNTDADAVREITLKVKLKPSEDRDFVAIGFQVTAKPAPLSAVFTKAFLDRDVQGQGEAFEFQPHQEPDLPINVTSITKENNND